jgi:hypothetical protein
MLEHEHQEARLPRSETETLNGADARTIGHAFLSARYPPAAISHVIPRYRGASANRPSVPVIGLAQQAVPGLVLEVVQAASVGGR